MNDTVWRVVSDMNDEVPVHTCGGCIAHTGSVIAQHSTAMMHGKRTSDSPDPTPEKAGTYSDE